MKTALVFLACLVVLPLAAADEVEDAITEALKLYKEGKHTEASTSLQLALSAINEKKGGSIAAALPDKIGDWKGGEVNSTNALAVLGAGTTVERNYDKKDKSASIAIIADSPMISQVMGLINNPAIAGLAGLRMKKAGDNTVTIQKDAGMGQIVVDNRFLIQIQGSDLKEEDILELAAGVRTDLLKNLK